MSQDDPKGEIDLSASSGAIYEAALRTAKGGDITELSDRTIQEILTAGVRLYVAKRQADQVFSPFVPDEVTATDVSITALAMIEAVDMQVFELTLWAGLGRP